MPFALLAYALIAMLVLGAGGVFFLIALVIGSVVYAIALFGHGLIQAMARLMNKGGALTSTLFYVIFYLPLLVLNWMSPLLIIGWVGNHRVFGDFLGRALGLGPTTTSGVNRAMDAVLSPVTHTVFGVFGATTSPPSPEAFVTMYAAIQIAAVVVVGFVWLAMAVFAGGFIARWNREQGEEGTEE